MVVKKLVAKNFRNYFELSTEFSPRLNIFLGNNGQGKTNLLEMVLYLINGYSFRTGRIADFTQFNQDSFHISGQLELKNRIFEIQKKYSQQEKISFINGKRATDAAMIKNFPVIVFSPDSLEAVKAASEVRRNLVDQFVISSSIGGYEAVKAYKRVLRSRNRILSDFHQKKFDHQMTQDLLEAINVPFIEAAVALTHHRLKLLRELLPEFISAMQNISDGSAELNIDYLISGVSSLHLNEAEIYQNILIRLKELIIPELSQGSSLVGPHKHDLKFLYGQNDSRIYCSQGQQRALILAFKMAQIVYHRRVHGVYPILMLDDVLSELDQKKRDSLIQFLHEIQTQIFLTSTELHLSRQFKLDDLVLKNIENGQIVKDLPVR